MAPIQQGAGNMITSHKCCRLVSCTSMMQISWSPRCSVGLRSGDCGGCSNTLSSLSCSRNQLEIILVRGMRCAILLEAEYGCTVAIKGLAWSATMVRQAVVERCSSAYFSWNEQLLSYRWLAISSKQSGNAPLIYDIISNHYCSLDILCFMSFLNSRDACAGKWKVDHFTRLHASMHSAAAD